MLWQDFSHHQWEIAMPQISSAKQLRTRLLSFKGYLDTKQSTRDAVYTALSMLDPWIKSQDSSLYDHEEKFDEFLELLVIPSDVTDRKAYRDLLRKCRSLVKWLKESSPFHPPQYQPNKSIYPR